MEISQFSALSELSGMEEPCFNSPWPVVNSFDDQLNSMAMGAVAFEHNTPHLHAHAQAPGFDFYKPVMEPAPRPTKQIKSSSWNSCISSEQSLMNRSLAYADQGVLVKPKEEGTISSKSNNGLTFGTLPSSQVQFDNQNNSVFNKGCQGKGAKLSSTSNATRLNPAQHHILAERKRREKLSQRFIALSALLPNLKKMDKASVLGDAIKYLKNLQEKVKTLEEQTKKRSNTESVVFVKRCEILADGTDISSSNENFSASSVHDQLPRIEARFSGKDVLIRIHCEKKAGVVEKTLAEIEKLHLSVINNTAMTFANYALDITIVAQMDEEFTMKMQDLVKNLRVALEQFM